MVMLASPMKEVSTDTAQALDKLTQRGWAFEVKYDGVRAVTSVRDGLSHMRSRSGQDLTAKFPELHPLLARLPDGLYDGELTMRGAGDVSFSAIASRVQCSVPRPLGDQWLTYRLFDLPQQPGGWTRRREALETIVGDGLHDGRVSIVLTECHTDGPSAWERALADGQEGLVAKHLNSPYINGRSKQWVKIKQARRVSAIVTGYVPGEGSASGGVGALLLSLHHEGELVPWGKCGTGFTALDRSMLANFIDQNPDVRLVAEIECMELTPHGKPRHPTFRGIRSDLKLEDCTVAQLI